MEKIGINDLNEILSKHFGKPVKIEGFNYGLIGVEIHKTIMVGDVFSVVVE
jgi:hypothetical protein